MKKSLVVVSIAMSLFFAFIPSSEAKDFFDNYVGAGIGKADYDLQECSGRCLLTDDDSGLITLRAGSFYTDARTFHNFPIDFGIEAGLTNSFANNLPSLKALVRFPLAISKTMPNGQFRPYLGIGIGSQEVCIQAGKKGVYSCDRSRANLFTYGIDVLITPTISAFIEKNHLDSNHAFENTGHKHRDTIANISTNMLVVGLNYHF